MNEIREELEICRKVLAGETVNGVKLGDAGITREWLEERIAAYERLLV